METVLRRNFFYLTRKIRPTEYVSIGVDVVDGMFEHVFLVDVVWMKQTSCEIYTDSEGKKCSRDETFNCYNLYAETLVLHIKGIHHSIRSYSVANPQRPFLSVVEMYHYSFRMNSK